MPVRDTQTPSKHKKTTRPAFDAVYGTLTEIRLHSESIGHVPIIDANPRTRACKAAKKREAKAQRAAGWVPPERAHYNERSTVLRVFGRLKDEYGGRHIRVRGHAKVQCHPGFGILALTIDQMARLVC